MGIAHQQCDTEDHGGGNQGSDHRDEFQQSARGAQHQRVGNTRQFHERYVDDERECRQGQLGTDELGQHLVEIAQHALQEFPLGAGMHERKSALRRKRVRP